ncbi:MAG TPA: hypothetical protein VJZ49_06500 [Syntrophales bacterium]|nr:hypothetical protein [Syntrophales bacterium]
MTSILLSTLKTPVRPATVTENIEMQAVVSPDYGQRQVIIHLCTGDEQSDNRHDNYR